MSLHQEEEYFLVHFSPLFMCFTDEELIERDRERAGGRKDRRMRGRKEKKVERSLVGAVVGILVS